MPQGVRYARCGTPKPSWASFATARGGGNGRESLESRMMRKYHVRFGGGPMEKGRLDRYLASGLPYLPPEVYADWLDPANQDAASVQSLLLPYTADSMRSYPVSTWVNDPRHDDPRCLEPAA
jgi:hypothetical protein